MTPDLARHRQTETGLTLIILLCAIIAGFSWGFWQFSYADTLVDEYTHTKQILAFLHGEWVVIDKITMIPGYHAIIAMLAFTTGNYTISTLRIYSLLLSICSTIIFYFTVRSTSTDIPLLKTSQYVFLPILYPFFFLIYTDVTSLLFVLLAIYGLINQRYSIAALAGFLSMLIRQSNIIWFVMSFVWTAYQLARQRLGSREQLLKLITDSEHLKVLVTTVRNKTSFYVLGLTAFIVFVAINRGIAIGDVTAHPFPHLSVGNLFFLLFVAFVVFLPLHLANLDQIICVLRRPVTVLTIGLLFVFYYFAFAPDHPYNTYPGSYLLRNQVLNWSFESWINRLALFFAIAFATLSIWVTKLGDRSHYLLYPFTIAALLPSWLIEPRYYIVPFVLFLIFRERLSIMVEYTLFGYFMLLSIYVSYGMAQGKFFL